METPKSLAVKRLSVSTKQYRDNYNRIFRNKPILFHSLKGFDWKYLHNKELKISVGTATETDKTIITVIGKDSFENMYILHTEIVNSVPDTSINP